MPGVDELKCYPACDNATEVLALKEGTDKDVKENYICVNKSDCTDCGRDVAETSDGMKVAFSDGTATKCTNPALGNHIKTLTLTKPAVKRSNWHLFCNGTKFITGIWSLHKSRLHWCHTDPIGDHRHGSVYSYTHKNIFRIFCEDSPKTRNPT